MYLSKFIFFNKRGMLSVFFIIALSSCATNYSVNDSTTDTESNVFELVSKADKAYSEGRWLEAEQSYRLVIKRVPQDYYAWFRIANTQLRQGNIESAIRFYKEAIKRNPEQPKTYYNLSTAYLFMSLDALRGSDQRLRDVDPGKGIIANRVVDIEKMIGLPVESFESPGSTLPKNDIGSLSVPSRADQ